MAGASPLSENDAAAAAYNFPSHYLDVSTDLRRSFRHGPIRVGSPAPDITLFTLEGERVDLAELSGGQHLALVFGSYTAPPCTLHLPALEQLKSSLEGSGSRLAFVYTREIHPDEPIPPKGRVVSPHRTLDEKLAAARLLMEEFALTMPILVDDVIGTVHRAFGALPFQAVVIDRAGIVVFRSEWVDAGQLGAVLANLDDRERFAGEGSMRNSYSEGLWGIDAAGWH
jgi:hypothetical protein